MAHTNLYLISVMFHGMSFPNRLLAWSSVTKNITKKRIEEIPATWLVIQVSQPFNQTDGPGRSNSMTSAPTPKPKAGARRVPCTVLPGGTSEVL